MQPKCLEWLWAVNKYPCSNLCSTPNNHPRWHTNSSHLCSSLLCNNSNTMPCNNQTTLLRVPMALLIWWTLLDSRCRNRFNINSSNPSSTLPSANPKSMELLRKDILSNYPTQVSRCHRLWHLRKVTLLKFLRATLLNNLECIRPSNSTQISSTVDWTQRFSILTIYLLNFLTGNLGFWGFGVLGFWGRLESG